MKKGLLMALAFVLCGTALAQSVEGEQTREYKPVDTDDDVFVVVEQDPEFPGGTEGLVQYLQQNIRYPSEARESNITGRVYVTFVIEKDGSVSTVRVLRDIGGGCGAEAVRVVEAMPRWKPGMQSGKPVRVQFNLPVSFQLRERP